MGYAIVGIQGSAVSSLDAYPISPHQTTKSHEFAPGLLFAALARSIRAFTSLGYGMLLSGSLPALAGREPGKAI